jgi:hypothetical protein
VAWTFVAKRIRRKLPGKILREEEKAPNLDGFGAFRFISTVFSTPLNAAPGPQVCS